MIPHFTDFRTLFNVIDPVMAFEKLMPFYFQHELKSHQYDTEVYFRKGFLRRISVDEENGLYGIYELTMKGRWFIHVMVRNDHTCNFKLQTTYWQKYFDSQSLCKTGDID